MVTEGYQKCRLWKLYSMPCHLRKLHHPANSNSELHHDCQQLRMMAIWAWVRTLSHGEMITFGWCVVSLHFASSLAGTVTLFKWHHRSISQPATGGWGSQCASSAERSPLSGINSVWDLWVCTIAYIGALHHSMFHIPCVFWMWIWQPGRSEPIERYLTTGACVPGLGNGCSIELAHQKTWISCYILTCISTVTTTGIHISNHIL